MNAHKNREMLEDAISKQCPEARRSLLILAQVECSFRPRFAWNFWNRKTFGKWKGAKTLIHAAEYNSEGLLTHKPSYFVEYESVKQSVGDIIDQLRRNWPSAWRHRCEPDKFVLALQTAGKYGAYSTAGKTYIQKYEVILKSSYQVEKPVETVHICSSNPVTKGEGVSDIMLSGLMERWASKKLGIVGTAMAFCMQSEAQVEIKAIVAGLAAAFALIQAQYDKAKLIAEQVKVKHEEQNA